jgi:integrase
MVAVARKGTLGWASEVFERRDSALLLIGYAGALGRGDLVGLTCGDITAHPRGGLLLPATATTRAGDKRLSAAESHASCPPCAAARWLRVAGAFDHGGRAALIRLLKFGEPFNHHVCGESLPRTRARMPLFRSIRKNGNLSATPLSGSSMHLVIRRRARLAGYDEDFVARLGVQSLRAGFITQAVRNGADPHSILRYTGHVRVAALQRYTEGDQPVDDAVPPLGL